MFNNNFIFEDPYKKKKLIFKLLPINDIKVPDIQRELSDSLVKKLVKSIEKIGFVEPISVIQENNNYYVINGQHRLQAAKILGIEYLPAIILPYKTINNIIDLNIEKGPTLKDKCHQAFSIFMLKLAENPNQLEVELNEYIEEAYFITLGIIYDDLKIEKFPGYAFEKVLEKVDFFLEETLENALVERKKRAEKLLKVKDILETRYKELDLKNPLLKEQIVTKALQEVYGKYIRKIDDNFYDVFEKISEKIPYVSIVDNL